MTAKKSASAKEKTSVVAKASPKKTATAKATPKKKPTAKKPAAAPKKSHATASKKRAAAAAKAKPIAAAPKKKAAAPKKKAAASRNHATAPAKKQAPAATEKKALAATNKKAPAATAKPTIREAPPSRPSERAMAVAAQMPRERALTDEEREAMSKCALTALAALDADGAPEVIVARIGGFVDEVRQGRRPEPNSQDVRLGLGVLWGEQVRAQVGWRWVHLSYPNGFASYALVPDDRAFACFPLNRLGELMRNGADGVNTSVPLFDSIRIGTLPARRENAYLVIG